MNVISDKDFIDIWHDLQFKKRHKKVKKCACFDSDSYTCYFLRYPNQIELDGRDYCQCSCHTEKEVVKQSSEIRRKMEAKNTVMKERAIIDDFSIQGVEIQPDGLMSPIYLFRLAKEAGILTKQAEISFKAGERKVVEWIRQHSILFGLDAKTKLKDFLKSEGINDNKT